MRKTIPNKETGGETTYVYKRNNKKVKAKVIEYGPRFKSGSELVRPKLSVKKVKRKLK